MSDKSIPLLKSAYLYEGEIFPVDSPIGSSEIVQLEKIITLEPVSAIAFSPDGLKTALRSKMHHQTTKIVNEYDPDVFHVGRYESQCEKTLFGWAYKGTATCNSFYAIKKTQETNYDK